jgi:hypothetical protein
VLVAVGFEPMLAGALNSSYTIVWASEYFEEEECVELFAAKQVLRHGAGELYDDETEGPLDYRWVRLFVEQYEAGTDRRGRDTGNHWFEVMEIDTFESKPWPRWLQRVVSAVGRNRSQLYQEKIEEMLDEMSAIVKDLEGR